MPQAEASDLFEVQDNGWLIVPNDGPLPARSPMSPGRVVPTKLSPWSTTDRP